MCIRNNSSCLIKMFYVSACANLVDFNRSLMSQNVYKYYSAVSQMNTWFRAAGKQLKNKTNICPER